MKISEKVDDAIDWTIARVSKRAAARRAHFRRMAEDKEYAELVFSAMRLRGYRAAKDSRNNGHWAGGNGTADLEIIGDLPAMREKSRELNRDDSLGSGITKTFKDNVVGTGIWPQSTLEDENKADRIESVFRERQGSLFPAEDCDFGSGQRLVFGKVCEDGDTLVKQAIAERGEPLWFECIEGDRLGNPLNKSILAGHEIREGVERDRWKRPVAYHVQRAPIADLVSIGARPQTLIYDRFDKSVCRHLKMPDRYGQSRGVPLFHAVLQDIRDLDLLLVASLKRTQIAACLAAFIKSDMPIGDILQQTAQQYGYKLEQEIEPGMIFRLNPGEELQTLIPNFPVPELVPFIVAVARKIGAALGICWQLVLKDFGDCNYSSARTNLLESRRTFEVMQQWFINNFLTPVWIWVLEDARLRGDPRMAGITDEDIRAVHWITNGWKWVDPETEANATEVELRIGSTTLRDVCAGKGVHWADNLKQQARENKLRVKLGLMPVGGDLDAKSAVGKPSAGKPGDQVPDSADPEKKIADGDAGADPVKKSPPAFLKKNQGEKPDDKKTQPIFGYDMEHAPTAFEVNEIRAGKGLGPLPDGNKSLYEFNKAKGFATAPASPANRVAALVNGNGAKGDTHE